MMGLTVKSFLRLETIAAMATVAFIVSYLLPASIWFEVRQVAVSQPLYEGDPVTMIIDRTINRSFEGEFEVTVRNADTNIVHCNGDGGLRYVPSARVPNPITLDWWANAPCEPVPAGRWVLETTWWVEWTPVDALDKVVIFDTTFTVLEEPQVQLQQQQLQEQVRELETQLELLKEVTK
jgi:hypothetical protein